jgi:hypothetical protein
MGREGKVAHAWKKSEIQSFSRKAEGKRPFRRTGVDGRLILSQTLDEQRVMMWSGFSWFRIETSEMLL